MSVILVSGRSEYKELKHGFDWDNTKIWLIKTVIEIYEFSIEVIIRVCSLFMVFFQLFNDSSQLRSFNIVPIDSASNLSTSMKITLGVA